jgi:N-acetylglucosaminyldiphosphoundecaprenol N-acetyl-beta-D-mannosaminyltransferase
MFGATSVTSSDHREREPLAPRPRVTVMGMDIDVLTEHEVVDVVGRALHEGRGGWIITPNLDQLRAFQRSTEMRAMYAQADLVVADGMPIVWASRIQGSPLPERVAGSSLIWSLGTAAPAWDVSIYLLGGNPGTAELAASELRRRSPALAVAGCHCPPIGFERDPSRVEGIVRELEAVRPGVVLVGLGTPKGLRLIRDVRPRLPRTWFVEVGISFSYVSGDIRRAPRAVQRLGLEWLHRLAQEPRRLSRRYLVEGIPFGLRLLGHAATRRALSSGVRSGQPSAP